MKVWVVVRRGRGLYTDEILHIFSSRESAEDRVIDLKSDDNNAIYDFDIEQMEV